MNFLHILGSDIPHHNRTLLAFLANNIAPHLAEKPHCWVVSQTDFAREFPQLNIRQFASKKALAKAVIAKNASEPTRCFFFHGQFNPWLWLAMLFGKLDPKRCAWHIWGADLYETAQSIAYKLFYPLRRLAQKRLRKVYGTQGDLDFFAKINPKAERTELYFPTKMPEKILPPLAGEVPERSSGVGGKSQAPHPTCGGTPPASRGRICPSNVESLTVLLGNSGDPSNRHLAGLDDLKMLGGDLQIRVPMGYPANNDHYIEQVERRAVELFGAANVAIWREPQPFAKYLANLTPCNFGYFPFERQQGIGTLCLLIMLDIPFALNRANPFCIDLVKSGVPFLFHDELSRENIAATAEKLRMLDKTKIAFFPENYRRQWLGLLKEKKKQKIEE